MSLFAPFGILVALAGIATVVIAIRTRGDGANPRANAMLIGGTMAAAFGIVIAGFAIAYNAAAPLDLDSGGAR
jgi:uncharacterized membrane protein HdeD (DUF308 family)